MMQRTIVYTALAALLSLAAAVPVPDENNGCTWTEPTGSEAQAEGRSLSDVGHWMPEGKLKVSLVFPDECYMAMAGSRGAGGREEKKAGWISC